MKNINIGQKEIIHFIGIGGIGMSGLAQVMKNMGFKIQGSDQNKNKSISNCLQAGIKVFIGHSMNNIKNATIIVKSSAVKDNNIEIRQARKKKIPIYSRAEVLANVVSLKKNIIITGSHGKTTTTSLVAKILFDQKLDPTIINGGVINSFKSNAKLGKGDWAILEADESDGSFLKLPINYSIVTNIDFEHIDYYKNYKNLENAFIEFINKTQPIGKSLICIDSKNIKKILNKIKNKNILTYGFNKKANYRITNARYHTTHSLFDLDYRNADNRKVMIKDINLKLIGEHNILNATAATAVCINLGVKIGIIKKALKNFSGVQRRMTKIFTKNKNDFFDDYAHHPTEIFSVLEGVRKAYNKRKIITVFEPHRYSRIISLKKSFSKSFVKSDLVLICPIYAAGEKKNLNFNLLNFAKLISRNSRTQVILVKNQKELSNFFKKNLISNEIIIGMGAGSISQWMRELKTSL
ncbi:MAG: UDP-N-acetylmuramate--L-alanine ligase [Candidatus Pelagibacter sp. TMED153]|nr:MAG: UDP-N-acetylmuramate--L-alanine ligase [Candidatus Pelagibacter sp. TMED153]|tara:strand:+ start:2130 stop:3527 length:1398 start_codon:yes stop_codon:yes gene_type:complete